MKHTLAQVHLASGGLAVRSATPAELRSRQQILLTERDRAILHAVVLHGFLTTPLIELAFFPPARAGERHKSSTKASRRVRALWLWQYLRRVEPPRLCSTEGRPPSLYALGPRALQDVRRRFSDWHRPVQLRRVGRLDHVFVDHDLKAAALWANLHAVAPRRGLSAIDWLPERELRARRLRVGDPAQPWASLPVLPDGYLEIHAAAGGVQAFFVEIDMATHGLDAFRRKVRAFEAFLSQGLFEQHFRRETFDVAVLSTSPGRIAHLRASVHKEAGIGRLEAYRFATFDVLDPVRFAHATWLTADGDERDLLRTAVGGRADSPWN